MFAHYDALWRHKQVDSFLIHSVRNHFAPSCVNLLFAAPGRLGLMSHFTLNLIRPKSIRPNWDQFDHGQFIYVYFWYYEQWRYNNNYWQGIRATYDILPSSPVNNCIMSYNAIKVMLLIIKLFGKIKYILQLTNNSCQVGSVSHFCSLISLDSGYSLTFML